jgi:hypothetical protein
MVTRTGVRMDETVDGLIKEIKKFFGLRGSDFILKINKDDDGVYYTIETNEWLKVSGEKYERFVDLLRELGFYWVDGSGSTLTSFIGFKYIIGTEEFENDNGVKIMCGFRKEEVKGKDRIYIKYITIKRPGDGGVG